MLHIPFSECSLETWISLPTKQSLFKKAIGDYQFLQVKNSLYLLRQNIYILLYVDVGILDKLLN